MSGKLRELKNRIRSVENTKKITRAMEMVAAAKLRRFQDMVSKARPFIEGLENLLKRLVKSGGADDRDYTHPFLEQRKERQPAVVLITPDTGLCGSYNNDLAELSKRFLASRQETPYLIGVGKSGLTHLKRQHYEVSRAITDLRASRVEAVLEELRQEIETQYLSGKIDSVYVVYGHLKAMSTYEPVVEKILPLEKPQEEKDTPKEMLENYIFEPSPAALFQKLIPLYFEAKVRSVFLESLVAEQLARMTAMHQATQNAKEMIESLTLLRNKARQAAITKEIIEIVSGSRALKII